MCFLAFMLFKKKYRKQERKSGGHIEKSSSTKAPSTERAVCPLLALLFSFPFLLTAPLSGDVEKYLLICAFFYLKKHRLLQMGRIFLFQLMWKVHKNETNKTLDKSKVLISTVYAVVTDMIPTPLKPNILCVVLWSARSSFEKLWCSGSAIQEAISILIWSSNLPAEWKWRCSLKELFDLAQIWKSNSYQFYVWTIMHKNTIISLNLKYTRQVIKK